MRRLVLAIAAMVAVPTASVSVRADEDLVLPRVSFSATAIDQSGAFESRAKIYYAGGRLRIEQGHGFSTTILDLNTGTECILMANHTYLVLPMDDELFRRFFPRNPNLTGAHRMGTTRLDGMEATKYAFGDEGGLKAGGYYWLSSTGIMLKRDYEEGLFGVNKHHLDSIQNVSIGPQPASLFQIPAGYRLAK